MNVLVRVLKRWLPLLLWSQLRPLEHLTAVVEPSLWSWFSVGVSGNVSGGWDGPQKMKVVETKVRG